jgi:hypothetical protein
MYRGDIRRRREPEGAFAVGLKIPVAATTRVKSLRVFSLTWTA